MPKARFRVDLITHAQTQPILFPHEGLLNRLAVENKQFLQFLALSKSGAEHVRFVLAPNPGASGGPLKEIASGGELSRLMLSIKKVLFEEDTMSVFVFDEIDSGISGQVAAKVGSKLSDFCAKRQAIVVTHLPQVACFGQSHFIVSKATKKDMTTTNIALADSEMREKELAKMISGVKLSTESLAQAKLLLREARKGLKRELKESEL
jgi:DNA repair protein RecN (Recombination protein N)